MSYNNSRGKLLMLTMCIPVNCRAAVYGTCRSVAWNVGMQLQSFTSHKSQHYSLGSLPLHNIVLNSLLASHIDTSWQLIFTAMTGELFPMDVLLLRFNQLLSIVCLFALVLAFKQTFGLQYLIWLLIDKLYWYLQGKWNVTSQGDIKEWKINMAVSIST